MNKHEMTLKQYYCRHKVMVDFENDIIKIDVTYFIDE